PIALGLLRILAQDGADGSYPFENALVCSARHLRPSIDPLIGCTCACGRRLRKKRNPVAVSRRTEAPAHTPQQPVAREIQPARAGRQSSWPMTSGNPSRSTDTKHRQRLAALVRIVCRRSRHGLPVLTRACGPRTLIVISDFAFGGGHDECLEDHRVAV